MIKKKYDVSVVIGRFQPIHKGHESIFHKALEVADNMVVIFGGYEGDLLRNLFSHDYRNQMLRTILTKEENKRTVTFLANDYLYNDDIWKIQIINSLNSNIFINTLKKDKDKLKYCLVGHDKDSSSFYLKMFPEWEFVGIDKFCLDDCTISSTDIRNSIFNGSTDWEKYCTPSIVDNINSIVTTDPLFISMRERWKYAEDYKSKTKDMDYPPIYTTVDNLVLMNNKVLLIERKSKNGKGMLALPGGFLNHNELLIDGAIRELKEETSIHYDSKYLKSKLLYNFPRVFDYPFRSSLGRLITNVFVYELNDDPDEMIEKGLLKAADDAKSIVTINLDYLMSKYILLHDDHYSICYNLLNSRICTY